MDSAKFLLFRHSSASRNLLFTDFLDSGFRRNDRNKKTDAACIWYWVMKNFEKNKKGDFRVPLFYVSIKI
jgi:hypothetical protein